MINTAEYRRKVTAKMQEMVNRPLGDNNREPCYFDCMRNLQAETDMLKARAKMLDNRLRLQGGRPRSVEKKATGLRINHNSHLTKLHAFSPDDPKYVQNM